MKTKNILLIFFLCCTSICFAQNKLFDKYSEMDNVTSVYISKKMFQMRVKDGNTRATFYVKQKGDLISELIMLADTDKSFSVIQLIGNFTLQDIQEITKEMNK